MGPLKMSADQLKRFAQTEGSDAEPWDTLLTMLAIDEHKALELLAQRTGLEYVNEPRVHENASRFLELVPPDVARQHQSRGSRALVLVGAR